MIGACLPSIGYTNGQIAEVYAKYPEVGWGVKNGTVKEYIHLITHLHKNKSEILIKKDCLITSRFNHSWKIRVDTLIDFIEPLARNCNEI